MYTIFAFLVALGLLVTIHEFGHYWVARKCGVKVLRFSLGFGPVLFKWQDKQHTEWVLSAIPLGGYVKMLDEREGDVSPSEKAQAFNQQSPSKRFAIVAAGPLANFLLAIVLYTIVHWIGMNDIAPMVQKGGANAYATGFQNADTILSIDGQTVQGWGDVRELLLPAIIGARQVTVEVENAEQQKAERTLDFRSFSLSHFEQTGQVDTDLKTQNTNYTLPISMENVDLLEALDIRFWPPLSVGRVAEGSAAEAVGLQVGDRFVQINEIVSPNASQFISAVQATKNHPEQAKVRLLVERAGSVLTVDVEPQVQDGVPRIGVAFAAPETVFVRYGVLSGIIAGANKTYADTVFHIKMLGKLLTNSISWKNLSGPVTIAEFAGKTAESGLVYYLKFIALISISMGILNLLPIPVLDGGHLFFYLIEMVRGKPLPERVMLAGQQLGLALVLLMMGMALVNDFSRLL